MPASGTCILMRPSTLLCGSRISAALPSRLNPKTGIAVRSCHHTSTAPTPLLGRTWNKRALSSSPPHDIAFPTSFPFTMSKRASSAASASDVPQIPRPSSSVILLSPQNQVLLLHRVRTSTSFASAHVFPGGNLDEFHDGDIPSVDAPERHQDGLAYRIGAIRETFEETGILLAKRKDGSGELVSLSAEERDSARKKIHGNQVKFTEWVDSVGGIPDTENLLPFTRWITPPNVPKRFTTQMYLYLLPLERKTKDLPSEMLVPTPDGGVEHTAATFAPAQNFLAKASAREIILFPPQAFLLILITKFVSAAAETREQQIAQRKALLDFLQRTPTADTPKGKEHATANISWADKVMSPHNLFIRESDSKVVLGLDKPGKELKGSNRGGDWERVVLVRFSKGGPSDVEVRLREDVLEEERKTKTGTKL